MFIHFGGYLRSKGEVLVIDYQKEFDVWKEEKVYLNLDGAVYYTICFEKNEQCCNLKLR